MAERYTVRFELDKFLNDSPFSSVTDIAAAIRQFDPELTDGAVRKWIYRGNIPTERLLQLLAASAMKGTNLNPLKYLAVLRDPRKGANP